MRNWLADSKKQENGESGRLPGSYEKSTPRENLGNLAKNDSTQPTQLPNAQKTEGMSVQDFVENCEKFGDEGEVRPVENQLCRVVEWGLTRIRSAPPSPPIGLKYLSWQPAEPPIELSECEMVTNLEDFIRIELAWLRARLAGTNTIKGGPGIVESIERLRRCGLRVELVVGKGDALDEDRLFRPPLGDMNDDKSSQDPAAPAGNVASSFEEWLELPLEEQRRCPWHFGDADEIPF